MEEYKLEEEGIRIKTKLPLQSLLSMRLKETPDVHSSLEIEAVIGEDEQKKILERSWQGTEILVTLYRKAEECLFFGRLDKLQVIEEQGRMLVQLMAKAETALLDREKKSRSFQNPNMTYKQVIQQILGDYSFVDFRGNRKEQAKIGEPIIQYEETDWSFLQRLSSHFECCFVGKSNSRGTMLSFALDKEKQRQLEKSEIIGWGIDESYYGGGCCEAGLPIGYARYLVVKTRENWDRGDYVIEEGLPYLLYEKQAFFYNGELQFTYRLGLPGLLYRKKIFNQQLTGISLIGTVRKTEGERVYIQLDIDKQEGADYPWKWAPQTNNIAYCMPETDTKVSLYFSSAQEKYGQAVLGNFNRNHSRYNNPQNREFMTLHQKKLGLYPQKLILEGQDGEVSLAMQDAFGIQINSRKGASFQAAGMIKLKGRQISVVSPLEVVGKTPASNIELCRDINLFAPGGVQTIGTGDEGKESKRTDGSSRQSVQNRGWQAAYTALAAIPAIDFSQDGEAECAIDIVICASIPRIGSGQATHAMMEVMAGKKESDSAFPHVFQSMDNYTVKGGYLLPKEEDTAI